MSRMYDLQGGEATACQALLPANCTGLFLLISGPIALEMMSGRDPKATFPKFHVIVMLHRPSTHGPYTTSGSLQPHQGERIVVHHPCRRLLRARTGGRLTASAGQLRSYLRGMRSTVLFALLAPFALFAQEKLAHSLLWRISTPGIARPSYLYGTVHSRDERAYQFGDSVLPALDRCAVVAGELDLGADQQMAMAMLTTLRIPDGKKLEDLYKKREWARVEAMMKDRLGPMAPLLYSVKPFFVMALFSEAEMGDDRPMVLDQFLQRRGTSNGQRVIGIETMNEQMAAIDAIPLTEQARMLLDHVDHQGYPGTTDAMLDAYARQDLEALLEVGEDAGGMPEELEKSLLTERNTRMVQRMDSLISAGEPIFFLIGAAHLPTPDGLIAGLRAQGHTVEAVISEHTPALEATPLEQEGR